MEAAHRLPGQGLGRPFGGTEDIAQPDTGQEEVGRLLWWRSREPETPPHAVDDPPDRWRLLDQHRRPVAQIAGHGAGSCHEAHDADPAALARCQDFDGGRRAANFHRVGPAVPDGGDGVAPWGRYEAHHGFEVPVPLDPFGVVEGTQDLGPGRIGARGPQRFHALGEAGQGFGESAHTSLHAAAAREPRRAC